MQRTLLKLILVTALASPAAYAQEDEADNLDKVVCKRVTETGSLVKKKKVCLTKRQWNKVAENGRSMGQGMQEDNGRVVTPNG